ncbi:MAG: hypothetical protein ABW133_23820, partial [Polyangiaceae bacterium]
RIALYHQVPMTFRDGRARGFGERVIDVLVRSAGLTGTRGQELKGEKQRSDAGCPKKRHG